MATYKAELLSHYYEHHRRPRTAYAFGHIRTWARAVSRLVAWPDPSDFERDHYDVSMAIGERMLLPAMRRASRDTLIIADGFSCREQIAQGTDRHALHLAQVVHIAMRQGPRGPAGDLPERHFVVDHTRAQIDRGKLTGFGLVGAGLVLAAAAARSRVR